MILNVQILRLLAALAVVLHHARPRAVPEQAMPQLPHWLGSVQAMGFAGVDVFFVISGAIMALTTRQLAPGAHSGLRFGLQRFGRIYVGWWPFFLIYAGSTAALGDLGQKDLMASFWLWPTGVDRYLPSLIWTLSFELYFYAVVAALLLLPRCGQLAGLGALGLAVLLHSSWAWSAGLFTPDRLGEVSIWQRFVLMPLVAEFVAGFLLCEWLQTRTAPASAVERTAWLAAAALLGALSAWFHLLIAPYPSGLAGLHHAPERALLLGGMACALLGWALRAPAPRTRFGQALARWGDASYAIYLSHLLVLAAPYVLAHQLGWALTGWKTAVYAAAIAAVLAFSLLHYRLIERPVHRWVRCLIDRLLPARS